MKSKTFNETIQNNTHQCEMALRKSERDLAAANDQELRLTRDFTLGLQSIAKLQMTHSAHLDADISRQLELREGEQTALQQQLGEAKKTMETQLQILADAQASVRTEKIKIEKALQANPDYLQKQADVSALTQHNPEVEANFNETQQECASKLAEYQADPLHLYLTQAGYATSDYSKTGIIRFLDGWIDRLSNYRSNRENELLLIDMQQKNKEQYLSYDQQRQVITKQLEKIRKNVEADSALPSFALAQTNAETTLADLKKSIKNSNQSLEQYAFQKDGRYLKAVELLQNTLQGETLESIVKRVRQTDTKEDDQIAQQLMVIRQQLETLFQTKQQLSKNQQKAQSDYTRAKTFERSARTSSDDLDRVEYSNSLDLSNLITGYMLGSISESSALSTIRHNRQEIEEERSSYSPPSSSGSSYGSSSGSSHSSSSSDFSSSDSSGGGDFSTTDSF